MEKIRLGLFDLFSFILPGIIVIISFYTLLHPVSDIVVSLLAEVKKMNTAQGLMVLILAYFIGIFMQYFSFKLFEWLACTIWRNRVNKSTLTLSNFELQITRIRHESPNNYDLLERWMALRGMSYNSFFASTLLFFTLLFRVTANWCDSMSNGNNLFYLLMIIVLSFLSIRRAITFHEWAIGTIESTEKYLNSIKR